MTAAPTHIYGITENFPLGTVYPIFAYAVQADGDTISEGMHLVCAYSLPICITQADLQAIQKNMDVDAATRLRDQISFFMMGIRDRHPGCAIIPLSDRLAVSVYTSEKHAPDPNIPWQPLAQWWKK